MGRTTENSSIIKCAGSCVCVTVSCVGVTLSCGGKTIRAFVGFFVLHLCD